MLTPANIKDHRFQVVGRGFYKTGDVDDYLSQVVSSYEMLFRENKELIRKMSLLANKLEEYRNDEEKIRKAVVQAQQLAARLIDDAKKAAEEIIDNADTKARSAESIADIRIKKKIDYVEEQIKETFDKARAQAKNATDKAETEAQNVIDEAKKKASELIDAAAVASKQQLETIEKQINSQTAVLSRLKEESSSFKADILERYEQQILLIKSMPDSIFDELGISKDSSEEYILRDSLDKALDSYIADNPSIFFPDESQEKVDEDYKSEITESIEESLNNSKFEDFVGADDLSVENDENSKAEVPLTFEDVFSYSDPSRRKSLFEENEPYNVDEEAEENYNFLENSYQTSPAFEIDENESVETIDEDNFIVENVEGTTENDVLSDFSIVNNYDDEEIVADGINFNDDFIPQDDDNDRDIDEGIKEDCIQITDNDYEVIEEDHSQDEDELPYSEVTDSAKKTVTQFSIDDITLDDIFKFEDDDYSEFLGYDESMFDDKKSRNNDTSVKNDDTAEQGFTITIDGNENFDDTVDFDFITDVNDEDDSSDDSVGFLKGLFNK